MKQHLLYLLVSLFYFTILSATYLAQNLYVEKYSYDEFSLVKENISQETQLIQAKQQLQSNNPNNWKWRKDKVSVNYNPNNYAFAENTYIYDGENTISTLEKRRSATGVLSTSKITFEYDANMNRIGWLMETWNEENGMRIPARKYEYEFNSDNQFIASSGYHWIDNQWIATSKSRTEYNGEKQIRYYNQHFNGVDWFDYIMAEYDYDVQGNDSITTYSFYNPSTDEWDYSQRYLYTFDSNSNLIEKMDQRYEDDWADVFKSVYIYDQNNNQLSYDSYIWFNSNYWKHHLRYEYEYTQDGDRVLTIYYREENGELKESYRMTSEYGNSPMLAHVNPNDDSQVLRGSQFNIDFFGYNVESVNIELSTDNGNSWRILVENFPIENQLLWEVPSQDFEECKIRFSSSNDATLFAQNEEIFQITPQNFFSLLHNTGKITLDVFNNGSLGANAIDDNGAGFTFNGNPSTLWGGGVVIGTPNIGVNGMMASYNFTDFSNVEFMYNFSSNNNFDQILETAFTDNLAIQPLGVEIKQRTLSKQGDQYVFVLYDLKNISGSEINNLYIGSFADWDIGSAGSNSGGYDLSKNLVYQFDPGNTSDPNYYGLVALSGMSGCRTTTGGAQNDRMVPLSWMSQMPPNEVDNDGDFRSIIADGPFNISANESVQVAFAFLAGTDEDDIKTQADLARADWNTGIVDVKEDLAYSPDKYSLNQNYPNPFNPETVISYQLPVNSNVSLKIYDMLGREINSLVNKDQSAGSYNVKFDASNLSSGIYIYTLSAGGYLHSKKMMLLK